MTIAKCTKCNIEKSLEQFNRDKRKLNGRESHCKECRKAHVYKWRESNKEHFLKYARSVYASQTDEQRTNKIAVQKEYRSLRLALSMPSWTKNRRQQMENNGVFSIAPRDVRSLKREDKCAACGETEGKFEIDHIVPVSKGGRHSIGNLQVLCLNCNRLKHARYFSDFRYRLLAS